MASEQLAIDVDTFDDVKPLVKRPVSPTPILISDDEIEILEVAAKLSRTTRTPRSMSIDSDIQVIGRRSPPPAFVDLVSDDEAAPKPIRPSSKSKQAVSRVSARMERSASAASGSRSPMIPSRTAPDNKLQFKDSRSTHRKAIYQGPESSIRQDTPKQAKKQAKVESEAEDEDVYEHTTILAPYDSADIRTRSDRREQPTEIETLVEPRPTRKRHYIDISPFIPTPLIRDPPEYYLWDVLREMDVLCYSRRKRARLDESLHMDHYAKSHQFRRAGGSIHEILQHNGRVVVCSSTVGGDDTHGATNAYNKAGTLISWCKSDPLRILDLEQGEAENLCEKHYSVRSIAYDPISNILACSGADNCVRTWRFDENNEVLYSVHNCAKYQYQARIASPHQITFKPGTSILAVGEQGLTIQNVSVEGAPRRTFDLVEEKRRNDHVTGSIAWGFGGSSSFILALSEPLARETTRDGYHHAFDPEARTEKPAFTFDATEAGDALCIDPTGDTAAIVTTDSVDFFLRIYDIRNRNSMASQTITLEPFVLNGKGEPEVNSMMFSSDGNYLALGRVDNCTHVYDSRMLKGGVLHNFKHSDTHLGPSSKDELYGVIGVQWVESRSHRLGLVTGGNDGCVRLWDPLRATEEGAVLAQADSDVAHFTLGDRFSGEHALVVGDSDGTVYIIDHPAGI